MTEELNDTKDELGRLRADLLESQGQVASLQGQVEGLEAALLAMTTDRDFIRQTHDQVQQQLDLVNAAREEDGIRLTELQGQLEVGMGRSRSRKHG